MARLRNVAVVGFAQAPMVVRDEHRIAPEILYPVVRRALADCGVERDAIDYQVSGSSDYVDGRPFGFVAALDVTGSWPARQDLHLEMDAAFAAHYAWIRMQAGECDTAIVCGYGKNSEGELERVLNLELDPYYHAPLGLGPTATAALQASALMARTGIGDADLAGVAASNRTAGARNPEALVREPVTADDLRRTPWAVAPLRAGYLPPTGDSAVCLVLAAEGRAEALCDRPAWIHGVDQRIELQTLGSRDLSRSAGARLAAERAFTMAGLARAADADVIELAATTPAEELILREALGLGRDGRPVVNPSGGPLCGHPFMMTGLVRLGEAFRQLSGRAGDRTVPGARRAVAHAAQGHCLQQNLFFVLGSERRWT
jgi:acetyl-CoA acetyltransferase